MKAYLFTFYRTCYLDDFPSLHRIVLHGYTLKDAYNSFMQANVNCNIIAISDVTEIADAF